MQYYNLLGARKMYRLNSTIMLSVSRQKSSVVICEIMAHTLETVKDYKYSSGGSNENDKDVISLVVVHEDGGIGGL
jgi:hypothetical protein